MVAPALVLLGVFSAGPVLYSLYLSLLRWSGLGPQTFIGLRNYTFMLEDPFLAQAAFNTIFLGIFASVFVGSLMLVLALTLTYGKVRGKEVFRTVLFLPILVSGVAVGVIFSMVFSTEYGLANDLLRLVGVAPIRWLSGDGNLVKPSIVILEIWRYTGYNMVIVMAGLQAIPGELVEAAAIDGANRFHTYKDVVIPLLRPILLFLGITFINGCIQLFDEPLLLVGPNGGPGYQGLTLAMYAYNTAFVDQRLGYGAAIGWAMGLVIFGLSILELRVFGRGR